MYYNLYFPIYVCTYIVHISVGIHYISIKCKIHLLTILCRCIVNESIDLCIYLFISKCFVIHTHSLYTYSTVQTTLYVAILNCFTPSTTMHMLIEVQLFISGKILLQTFSVGLQPIREKIINKSSQNRTVWVQAALCYAMQVIHRRRTWRAASETWYNSPQGCNKRCRHWLYSYVPKSRATDRPAHLLLLLKLEKLWQSSPFFFSVHKHKPYPCLNGILPHPDTSINNGFKPKTYGRITRMHPCPVGCLIVQRTSSQKTEDPNFY